MKGSSRVLRRQDQPVGLAACRGFEGPERVQAHGGVRGAVLHRRENGDDAAQICVLDNGSAGGVRRAALGAHAAPDRFV